MTDLMLHCGADAVERSALEGVILPAATRSYSPVAYSELVNIAQDELGEMGYRFLTEAHGLMKDGSRYFGLMELTRGLGNGQHALVMGVRASLDKSIAPSFAFGSQVFVCDNLSFTGEVVMKRKQTTFVQRDLRPMIADAVSRVKLMSQNQDARFEIYQSTNITTAKAGAIISEMYRRKIVNPSRLGKVIDQWDTPDHDFGGRTAWRLFNATTEALKGSPVFDMPGRTMKLQGLMDEVADVDTNRLALAA